MLRHALADGKPPILVSGLRISWLGCSCGFTVKRKHLMGGRASGYP